MRKRIFSALGLGLAAAVIAATGVGVGVGAGESGASAATLPSKTGSFFVGFNSDTPTGGVSAAYPNHWQPYPDGMSSKYYSNQISSIHNGVLDFYLHDGMGMAGTFGTKTDAYSHQGGTFSIRMRTRDGAGVGLATMLWPSSDSQDDGEIDFPEGSLNGTAHVYHHLLPPNNPGKSYNGDLHVDMSEWHTYSVVWVSGKSVKYYVDDELRVTVTDNVPTSEHRFMIQTGNTGTGHVYIDWVRTT